MMQYSEADDTREPLPIQAYRGKGESSYWSSAGEKTGEVYLMGVVVSNRGAQPSYGNPAEAIPRGLKPLASSSLQDCLLRFSGLTSEVKELLLGFAYNNPGSSGTHQLKVKASSPGTLGFANI